MQTHGSSGRDFSRVSGSWVGDAGRGPARSKGAGALRDVLIAHWEQLDLSEASERVVAEVAFEQASSVARLFSLLALTGITTLLVLTFGLRHEPTSVSIGAFGIAIAAVYGLILYRIHHWSKLEDRRRAASGFLDNLTVLASVLGVAWASLSTIVVVSATHTGRDLLFGIDIGVLSSSLLLTPRKVALACWIPAMIGGTFAAWRVNAQFAPLTALAFVSYGVLIGSAMLFTNRNLVLQTVSRMRVEEQGEVIGLLLRDFEENASDWLWETDRLLRLTHVSPRLARVTGKPADMLLGISLRSLIFSLASTRTDDEGTQTIIRSLDRRAPIYNGELNVRIAGQERFWNMVCEPVIDAGGEFQGYRGIGSDITNAKRSQREIAFLARHDVLTGLPNRRMFGELLHAACQAAGTRPVTLLCVDLDRFKDINDRFGHPGGDALLVVVAQRLRDSVRHDDVVARLGGDEFAVILQTADISEARAVIQRILDAVSMPLHVQGARVEIAASIGAARAPEDAGTATLLLHDADLALYRAKNAGRGAARFFTREMADERADARAIETDLRQAIAAGELFLEYQPIVSLPGGELRGAEALVRWAHPARGRLAPDRFIGIAEQTGIIVDLGAWVMRTATRSASHWARPLRIAVNVSAVQLRDRNLAAVVGEALSDSGLQPDRLEVEITETALLSSASTIKDVFTGFRERGIRIALDDFGLGFSSLSHVCSFPFNKIKIAQDFVADIENRADKQAVVRAIADLGQRLGLTTTAEGVETHVQLAMLREFGCTEAQGFLLGRPMSEDAFRRLVLENGVVDGRVV